MRAKPKSGKKGIARGKTRARKGCDAKIRVFGALFFPFLFHFKKKGGDAVWRGEPLTLLLPASSIKPKFALQTSYQ